MAKLLAADIFDAIISDDPEHFYLMPKSLMYKGWQQQKNRVGVKCGGLTPFQLLVGHCHEYVYAENFMKIVKFYDLMYDGCLTEKVRRNVGHYQNVQMSAA